MEEDVNRAGEVSYSLIKHPNALEYACLNIWRANRRSVFKSEFVSSTQVIEESDAADKPDTVLETEEGRIHNRWRGHEIVGRIVVGRRGHDDDARRAATLKAGDALRMSFSKIFSAVGAGNARRLPRNVSIGTA